MQDSDEKQFAKEDLELVEEKTETPESEAADVKSESEDKSSEQTDESTKAQEPAEEVKEDKSGKKQSVFDESDDDDGDDEPEDKEPAEKDGDESKDDEKAKDPDEPKDWREQLIAKALKGKENELTASKLKKRQDALRKELARYKSQEDYMLSGMAAKEKIRSGEYKLTKLPEDATEEEIAAWRKENDVPDEAKDYDIPKIAGHKWTEEDTPFIDTFKGVAHKSNLRQDQLDNLTQWYADTIAEQQDVYLENLANQDRQDAETLEDELRAELGPQEYKPTSRLVQRFLKDKENGIGGFEEMFRNARYPDENGGYRRLINHPGMARWLIDISRDTYGDAALINGDARTAMSNRKAEIEKIMKEDMNKYWKDGLDKEYGEILKNELSPGRGRRSA